MIVQLENKQKRWKMNDAFNKLIKKFSERLEIMCCEWMNKKAEYALLYNYQFTNTFGIGRSLHNLHNFK